MSASESIDFSRKSSEESDLQDKAESPTQNPESDHEEDNLDEAVGQTEEKDTDLVVDAEFQVLDGSVVNASEQEDVSPHLFLRIARKVVLMCRVCMRLRVASKAFMEVWATVAKYGSKHQTDEEQRESSKAAFDFQYFKSQHNKLSNRAIQTTEKTSECRSMEELELLLVALRSLLSIRHYKKSYQLLLAKIMRYERFRRRRVITKKGHCANSFYFIYSGGVSFTTDEDGSSAFEEEHPADLRKGARFGEIPVLKGLQRSYTTVCMEETELLVVDKEDFFANKLDEVLVEESHHRFIFFRSLNLLESLPDSSIEVLSNHSTTEEFLYGQVIPNDMDHLIFVIKGRFVILRLVDLTRCHSYHKLIIQELPFMNGSMHQTESFDTFLVDKRLLNLTGRRASAQRQLGATENSSKRKARPVSLSGSIAQRYPANSIKDIDTYSSGASITIEAADSSDSQRLVRFRGEKRRQQNMGSSTSLSESEDIPLSTRRSSRKSIGSRPLQLPKALAVAVYMKLDSIEPGEVFGLRQYFVSNNVKDRRPFSIQSQGTKIVRIGMEIFTEIADQKTLQKVRKLKSFYPSDDQLCEHFIKNNIWKIFKKNMIAELTSKSHHRLTIGQDPESGQDEAVYEIDKIGILNLPAIAKNPNLVFSKPPYYLAPAETVKEDGSTTLPEIKLQLIHGMAKAPASLKHLLY
ncbi:cyclic nucleotide-binding domain-containing protein 2-like [Heptranchias perlo]|uniref:cyclic nucleotide-binding domain-containing protein 2-like n=1 Tax=Heptranchias perlo TaxID=212740 RepID=UPI003559B978